MVAAKSEPCSHTPVVMITRPVNVTTMIVSMKVWVMDTRPWRTGWVVWAAAAAMAAEPMPDSLENAPRATPICTARISAEPAKPPTAAVPEKASVKIRAIAAGTSPMLTIRIQIAPTT